MPRRDPSRHVLILTPGFPGHEADDSCIPALQSFVRAFVSAETGWRLTVVALQYPGRTITSWHGVTVHAIGGGNRRGVGQLQTGWRALRAIAALHAADPFSVVHSIWLTDAALVGRLVARRLGIPQIVTLMGQDARGDNRYWWLLRPLELVSLSRFQQAHLPRRAARRSIDRIPWGVDPDELAHVPARARGFDLVGVGSLIPVKNWPRFIRIAAAVHRRARVTVALIGDGPERERLRRLAASHRLPVRFLGQRPRHEVLSLLKASRVLLHTAEFESFAFVLAEALGAGCRVLSTPVGIAPEAAAIETYATDSEAASTLEAMLLGAEKPEPAFPYTVAATVEAHVRLYERTASRGACAGAPHRLL